MHFFYRWFYHPWVNLPLRNLFRLFGNALPHRLRIPISGKVNLQISPEGQTIRLYTNPSNSMAKLVYWNEGHNHEYTDVFLRLLARTNVFMDIGASIGYYSIVAKTFNPNIEVHAFEPAKGPFHYLKKNFGLNAFSTATAHHLAISDGQGELSFFAPFNEKYAFLKHHLGGDGSLLDRPEETHLRKTTVKTNTIDALVKELDLHQMDLIKMDTESTEDRVLRGGEKSIARFRPIIISEVLFDTIEVKLDQILREWDYVTFRHNPEGVEHIDQLARERDDGASNFFFVPREKMHGFTAEIVSQAG